MQDRVTLTLDGRQLEVKAGTTLLEAAAELGISIPTLCHEPELDPIAGCRMCLVEIEGTGKLEPACATPARAGMTVQTRSDAAIASRRQVIEMLRARHPRECPGAALGVECRLCGYAEEYGVEEPRMGFGPEPAPIVQNGFMTTDASLCVRCTKCVRVCEEIQGIGALTMIHRGSASTISPGGGGLLASTDCEMCGNCMTVCPTGAIRATGMTDLAVARKVATTCGFCGVGCQFELNVHDGRVVGVTSPGGNPVNGKWLCVKGRFGWEFINHPDRLKTPLIRRDGQLVPASWDEALTLVATRLGELAAQHGPDALGFMSSSRCTNEENYLMAKLARAAVGTNNIDQCARTCHAPTVAGLAASFGSGAMTNAVAEIADAETLFVIGANPTEAHPIVGLKIKEALRKGARVIVADPRQIWLAKKAWLHLPLRPGTDLALINAMAHVILEEGLANTEFIAQRTEGFEEFRAIAEAWPPERAAALCEIDAEDIRRAARAYATSPRGAIFYTLGITEHTCGTQNVMALANLVLLTGQIGRASTGVNPLRGQNNVQGACDMGAQPDVYPGYQKVAVEENRRKFEAAWGVPMSARVGQTLTDMIENAAEGHLKGLYVMGEDPIHSEAHARFVRDAMSRLDFLVVQDIFLSETAKIADVVLPASCFGEKDGTFTNTERRVQRVRKAVEPPGEAREDWRILCEVSTRLGYPMPFASAQEVWDEMAALAPMFCGITYPRIEGVGLQWPCPTLDHPGTPYLHAERFTRGLGKFHPAAYTDPAELTDAHYPWVLSTGRVLYHYNVGTMTRRVAGMEEKVPESYVEVHPKDLERLGIAPNQMIRVSTRRGSLEVRAVATRKVRPGRLWMPFHFAEANANDLTIDAYDTVTRTAEYKVAAAKIEAIAP